MFSFRDKGSEEESPLPVSVNSYLAEKVFVLIGEVILGACLTVSKNFTIRAAAGSFFPSYPALRRRFPSSLSREESSRT